MVVLEGIDEGSTYRAAPELPVRMREKGEQYGLVRREGFELYHSGPRHSTAMNMTHMETPLEPR